jgi:hypothetical protein
MSAPSWERSKENVAPLARGRDKSSLHTALHATRNDVAEMHAAHEQAVAAAAAGRGAHAGDPLAPAAAFVKWAADAYPPRAAPLLTALERSCRAFVDDPRYKNDPRFVRLWVRYADAREDPLDCFAYMRTHRIGGESALFYEAWATTLEYKKDFGAADAAYRLGLEHDAQPKNRLEQRQHEFLARMVARDRRAEAKAAKAQRGAKAAAASAARSGRNTATARAPAGPSDENVRPALGALTTGQASSGRRPTLAPHAATTAPSALDGGLASSQQRRARPGSADTSFQVFADPEPSDPAARPGGDDGRPLPTLAKLDQVRKEDEGELPSKWAGAVLTQSSPLVRARARSGARQRPAALFEIFSDPGRGGCGTGGDEGASGEGGGLGADARVSSGGASDKSAGPNAAVKHGRWTSSGPASPTINTKIAMQEVEDMFNSPLPFEREEPADRPRPGGGSSSSVRPVQPPAGSPAFEIFCDAPEPAPEPAPAQGPDREEPPPAQGPDREEPPPASSREDKENAGGVRSVSQRPVADPLTEAAVLQPLPELEFAMDPEDPATYVEVEYEPLPQAAAAPAEAAAASPDEVSKRMEDWCIESCPDLPGYEMMENNCDELSNGSIVLLQGGGGVSRSFFIESKLGDGTEGKSAVFAATPIDGMGIGGEAEDDDEIVAIKAADNVNLLWEFYVYSVVHARAGGKESRRGVDCIPKALFFYHGAPLSYLVTDRVSVASLAQVVDLASTTGSCSVTAAVALFFSIELLRAVEVVHSAGVIHADVTLQNVVIRKDGAGRWTGAYDAAGRNGWASKGVALIDFNHAVDVRHAAVGGWTGRHITAHTAFLGNAHMDATYTGGDAGPWGFNVDCRAVAACGRKLLAAGGAGDVPDGVWEGVFGKLAAVDGEALGDETGAVMRECRYALEDVLIAQCAGDDGAGVRAELKGVFVAAEEASQAGDVTCA